MRGFFIKFKLLFKFLTVTSIINPVCTAHRQTCGNTQQCCRMYLCTHECRRAAEEIMQACSRWLAHKQPAVWRSSRDPSQIQLFTATTVNSRPQHFQSSSSKQGAGPLTITSLILRFIIPLPFQNWRRALSQINPALLLTWDSSRLFETGVAGSHLKFPFFLLIIPLFVLPVADVNTPSGRHQQRPFSEN